MDEEKNPFSAKELVHFILHPTSKTLYLAICNFLYQISEKLR